MRESPLETDSHYKQSTMNGGASSCIEDKKLIVEKPEVSLSMHTSFKSFAAALACQNFPQSGFSRGKGVHE